MSLLLIRRLCGRSTLKSRSLTTSVPKSFQYLLPETCFKQANLSLIPAQSITTITTLNNICVKHYSTSSKKTEENEEKEPESEKKKMSLFQRFKQMYRDYWYVLVPVHLVTSAAWFGGFYYLASSGVDIVALLECLNFNEKIVNTMRNSSMGYVAITYGLYKIATPARYAVTLGGTTLSINYLKKWGYIKPMPSKERLKEIYTNTKEGMREKKENVMGKVLYIKETVKETKEGIKEKKDNLVSSVKETKDNIQSIKKKVIGNKGESKR